MLHELLLALHGHHGQIFSMQHSGASERIRVNGSLPLFHPAEVKILDSLLEIGTEFWRLQEFIRRHRDHQQSKTSSGGKRPLEMKASIHAVGSDNPDHHLCGLYVEALCHGLEIVLEPYKDALATLERSVLENGGEIQLTEIQHVLSPFQRVLEALNRLIKQLYVRKAHGCYILDIVYKASASGIPKVHEAMNK